MSSFAAAEGKPAGRLSSSQDPTLGRLAAYGHSYVQGAAATAPSRRFVNIASSKLGCAFDNNGVGGSLSTDTVRLVTTNPPPPAEYYLLMTGLNDARLYGGELTGIRTYATALAAVFEAFEMVNPSSQVIAVEQPYLCDYSQHSPYDKGSDALVDAYNRQLREVAASYASVVLARVGFWNKRTMIAADTVHPNDLGHREIARAVCQATVVRGRSG